MQPIGVIDTKKRGRGRGKATHRKREIPEGPEGVISRLGPLESLQRIEGLGPLETLEQKRLNDSTRTEKERSLPPKLRRIFLQWFLDEGKTYYRRIPFGATRTPVLSTVYTSPEFSVLYQRFLKKYRNRIVLVLNEQAKKLQLFARTRYIRVIKEDNLSQEILNSIQKYDGYRQQALRKYRGNPRGMTELDLLFLITSDMIRTHTIPVGRSDIITFDSVEVNPFSETGELFPSQIRLSHIQESKPQEEPVSWISPSRVEIFRKSTTWNRFYFVLTVALKYHPEVFPIVTTKEEAEQIYRDTSLHPAVFDVPLFENAQQRTRREQNPHRDVHAPEMEWETLNILHFMRFLQWNVDANSKMKNLFGRTQHLYMWWAMIEEMARYGVVKKQFDAKIHKVLQMRKEEMEDEDEGEEMKDEEGGKDNDRYFDPLTKFTHLVVDHLKLPQLRQYGQLLPYSFQNLDRRFLMKHYGINPDLMAKQVLSRSYDADQLAPYLTMRWTLFGGYLSTDARTGDFTGYFPYRLLDWKRGKGIKGVTYSHPQKWYMHGIYSIMLQSRYVIDKLTSIGVAPDAILGFEYLPVILDAFMENIRDALPDAFARFNFDAGYKVDVYRPIWKHQKAEEKERMEYTFLLDHPNLWLRPTEEGLRWLQELGPPRFEPLTSPYDSDVALLTLHYSLWDYIRMEKPKLAQSMATFIVSYGLQNVAQSFYAGIPRLYAVILDTLVFLSNRRQTGWIKPPLQIVEGILIDVEKSPDAFFYEKIGYPNLTHETVGGKRVVMGGGPGSISLPTLPTREWKFESRVSLRRSIHGYYFTRKVPSMGHRDYNKRTGEWTWSRS